MIRLEHICKSYGNHAVFEDLSLSFEEERTTVITGPSGCGKTTLLRMMTSLEKPDRGTITGMEGRKISIVFQENRLCENLSVSRNIRLPLGHLSREDLHRQTSEIAEDLSLLNMEGCADQKVSELSGGMKRRVSILRALRTPCDIFFFDEPLQGLDEENRRLTMERIQTAIRRKTTIWITHDSRDLEDMKEAVHLALPL